jgi:hypothetical protein
MRQAPAVVDWNTSNHPGALPLAVARTKISATIAGHIEQRFAMALHLLESSDPWLAAWALVPDTCMTTPPRDPNDDNDDEEDDDDDDEPDEPAVVREPDEE